MLLKLLRFDCLRVNTLLVELFLLFFVLLKLRPLPDFCLDLLKEPRLLDALFDEYLLLIVSNGRWSFFLKSISIMLF